MTQIQQAAPQKGAEGLRKATGGLKRDINLMPANESSEKIARIGTYALGFVVGAALLAYFAVFVPSSHLSDVQEQANIADQQIQEKQASSAQFDTDVALRDKLQGTLDALSGPGEAGLQPSDLLAEISSACPDAVTVTSFELSGDGATIDGLAPDDGQVAQFIDNLKSMGVYQAVGLADSQNYESQDKPAFTRKFEIAALYAPVATPTPLPTPSPTATQKGGDGK